ncbi:MAG: HlyD family type I secretion periplasmic adaptor subunit [Pseudomonadota bacterium]
MLSLNKSLDIELSLPLDIESERVARIVGRLAVGVCLLLILLTFVAAIAPIREVSIADGRLVTERPPMLIEHFDGGLIEEILVKQGDVVTTGMPIVRLSREQLESELAQIRARRNFLAVQRERLLAHLEDRQPDFQEFNRLRGNPAEEQLLLFRAESAGIKAKHNAFAVETRERRLEQESAMRRTKSAVAQLESAKSQFEIQARLLDRGYATRKSSLEAEADLQREHENLASAQVSELAAVRAVSDVESRRLSYRAELIEDWSKQIAEVSAQIVELSERQRQHLARIDRLDVRTPINGIVQEVSVNGRGEVLVPGDHIATIIPVEADIIAEIRIAPNDISFVEVGSISEITVESIDREIHGVLNGSVVSISPTTVTMPDKNDYYIAKVEIDIDRTLKPLDFVLLPGMTLQSKIITGEKSVLRYMLKPIVRAFERSFSER